MERPRYTPQNELVAELKMQLRFHETYAQSLRMEIATLTTPTPPDPPTEPSTMNWQDKAESLDNTHHDTMSFGPPYESLQQIDNVTIIKPKIRRWRRKAPRIPEHDTPPIRIA